MANINILAEFILSYEGGFVNDPDDRGGATNKGVTISTWKAVGYDKDGDGDIDVDDLRLLTDKDVTDTVMKPHYWDRWRADEIRCQSIANILVDWVWASGAAGIKPVQKLLGVTADGIVGPKTIAALNARSGPQLFSRIKQLRRDFIIEVVMKNPSQQKYLKGWLRRLEALGPNWIVLNDKNATKLFF